MSVRAYRVNKIEYAKSPSWNLWSEREIMDWLEENSDVWCASTEDGGAREIEVEVEALKKLVRATRAGEIKNDEEETIDEETIHAIEADIAWAKKKREEFIRYTCF